MKVHKNIFNVVEEIFLKCSTIEKSFTEKDKVVEYNKILESLIVNLYQDNEGIKSSMYKLIESRGKSGNIYQYVIGLLVQDAHIKSAEYKGKVERTRAIEVFIDNVNSKDVGQILS